MLKYKIRIPIAVTIIAAIGIVTAFAVTESLHKERDNKFVPAMISLAVIENNNSNTDYNLVNNLNWEESDNEYTANKLVEIANLNKDDENNADAYIRVCIIPRWTADIKTGTDPIKSISVDVDMPIEDFGSLTGINLEDTSTSYTMGAVTFNLAENWNENWFYNEKDGYFYYRKIVPYGDKTTTLLNSVTVSAETKELLDALDTKLTVDILADGIQSEGQAVGTMWKNIKVDSDGRLEKN